MTVSHYGRSALRFCATVAALSGCGGLQPRIGAPGAIQQSPGIAAPESGAAARTVRPHRIVPASTYEVLYRFRGPRHHHGAIPDASLINVKGTLYGTTLEGGANGVGTVFSITATGKEQVLHSFGGGSDDAHPGATLINVNGTLYGTTSSGFYGTGCRADCGTVFSVTTDGTEKVLYTFAGGSDGAGPTGNLINVNGVLYGTTFEGGANDNGTVFSITTTGTEKVLHRFSGGSDGANPQAGLINVNGTLYGTTASGGSGCTGYGCGTVFSVTTDGTEKVLYSFGGGSDGENPEAGLINVKGTLYGTTQNGGGSFGYRTVFSVTPTGTEKVLYGFRGGPDGAYPHAGLINVKGALYSTTREDGANGYGTIFSVTTTGAEKVLYSFGGGSDGDNPEAGLINVKGTLYGTTPTGGDDGCHHFGCGTVFALTL
jgi:uncharacterized repeat protein (TIGR03803 family)